MPTSRSACRTHFRSVSAEHPIIDAIEHIASHRLLVDSHGPREAARVFARVLGAVVDHGEDVVAAAVKAALASNRSDLLELGRVMLQPQPLRTSVPQSLAGYEIEAASASTYDRLLGAGDGHE